MQNFKSSYKTASYAPIKLYLLLQNQIARDTMEFWNKKKASIFSNLGKFKNNVTSYNPTVIAFSSRCFQAKFSNK